jgi:hypothetical protein
LDITQLSRPLLYIHIFCGACSLVAAFGAMLVGKGRYPHKVMGSIFFYSMTGIFVTSIPLAMIKHNLFLLLIGIFSYYLAFSGWRYAKNRSGKVSAIDWIASGVMLVAALGMMGLGIFYILSNTSKWPVLLVFGSLGGLISISNLKSYQTHQAWAGQRITNHLTAMLGAVIAALTAFSVTNIPLEPKIILWLGPTILIVPLISWWTRKVRDKNLG